MLETVDFFQDRIKECKSSAAQSANKSDREFWLKMAARVSSIADKQDRFFCSIRAMHKYRLYVYDAEDRLLAPAMVIAADNDEAATEQAEKMLDGVRAELRDGDRLVIRLPPKN